MPATANNSATTLATRNEIDDDAYGGIELDDNGEAIEADEKPKPEEPAGSKVKEENVEPVPVKKPEPIVHPKSLLRRARDLGLSELQVETIPTDELEDRLYVLERETIAELKGRAAAASGKESEPSGSKTAPAEEDTLDWGNYEFEFEDGKRPVQEKDISAPIVHVVKSLSAKIKKLEEEAKQRRDQETSATAQNVDQQLDVEFAKFPVLGKGNVKEVKGTPFMERRVAVVGRLSRMTPEERASTTMEKAVEKAVSDLFGTVPEQKEEAEKPAKSQASEQFAKGAVAKPTGRKAGDLPRGKKKAEATVADWLAENLPDDEGDDDVKQGEY